MTDIRTMPATLPDFRVLIQAELDRRQWSAYRLVQALKGKRPKGKNVPPTVVYSFLRGETSMNSDDLGLVFDALSLQVRQPK